MSQLQILADFLDENPIKFHVLGFTGTRVGLSEAQKNTLKDLLQIFLDPKTQIHHGDCLGADAEIHELCVILGFSIHIHPPSNPRFRAFCESADFSHQPKEYLARNRAIVNASSLLVAAPSGPEKQRSGTWATVRFARQKEKPIVLIMPSGSVEFHGL